LLSPNRINQLDQGLNPGVLGMGIGGDSDNEEDIASPESIVKKGKKKKSKKTTSTSGA